jgi:hypothetical protein
MRRLFPLFAVLFALVATSSWAAMPAPAFRVEVLVDGRPIRQYPARGTIYIEALKGKDYAIRLHNPCDVRVAVALSVDGLNTIDALRTTAQDARKWVLDPHETIVISGWQVDMNHARKFFFTSEQDSYAQWLGKTQDLGVITAVFFRERVTRIEPIVVPPIDRRDRPEAQGASGASGGTAPNESARSDASAKTGAPAPNMAAMQREDYAATGIGDRTDHAVRRIHMNLEDQPAGSASLRYEFRPQLVRLGVLPPVSVTPDPLMRREGARGFEPGFCPEPPVRRR